MIRSLGSRARGLSRRDLDITAPAAVNNAIAHFRPRVVINCAGWTDVESAESDPVSCFRVNAEAVASLAAACRDRGCLLVQVSSDYVFGADHRRASPYTEDDPVGPLNAYGRSKVAAEDAARGCPDHLVIRTSGLHTARGSHRRTANFLDTMLSIAASGRRIRVVRDQYCSPSHVPDVARGILALIDVGARGTFHVVNGGVASWADVAEELFARCGMAVEVERIESQEYGSAVERPAWSVLNARKLEKAAQIRLPDWRQGVADYVSSRRSTFMERIPCGLYS